MPRRRGRPKGKQKGMQTKQAENAGAARWGQQAGQGNARAGTRQEQGEEPSFKPRGKPRGARRAAAEDIEEATTDGGSSSINSGTRPRPGHPGPRVLRAERSSNDPSTRSPVAPTAGGSNTRLLHGAVA